MRRHPSDAIVPLLLASLVEKEELDVWSRMVRTRALSAWIQARSVSLKMTTKGESEQVPLSTEILRRMPLSTRHFYENKHRDRTDASHRPVSKAYVNCLEDRINQLEALLKDKDKEQSSVPEPSEQELVEPTFGCNTTQEIAPTPIQMLTPEPTFLPQPPQPLLPETAAKSPSNSSTSETRAISTSSPTVHKLLSTRGHLSFDQLAGRLRYFGPTTNCHIYSQPTEPEDSSRQAQNQERRTQRIISGLSQPTHDHLMELFWRYYNSVIHVIHREAFEEGKETGMGPFYSGFLHICILAAGYRFADKTRPDIIAISLPNRESTLHREAKMLLDYEMERPGGITFIAALLILGDLEVGCGRDNVGWLYSGMACRLCFDIGLHQDRSDSGLVQRDIEIGRLTLWACVVYDRYWALFLGRPTALKPDDLEIYDLSEKFNRLGASPSAGSEGSLETQIYQALIEVMELAGRITEIMDKVPNRSSSLDRVLYLQMSALDRELESLYKRLPLHLKYTSENASSAPFSFFLLHQQYYSSKILLHRQFARYEDIVDDGERPYGDLNVDGSHLSAFSRETCTQCAGRIAQLYWQHRKRFDTRKIFVTGLQHAGNAATALVAAIASSTDRVLNDKNMRYLECLTAALKDMTETYQPAERMATVLNEVLLELRNLHPECNVSSTIPVRRGSSAGREDEPCFNPSKRAALNRAREPSLSSFREDTSHNVQSHLSSSVPTTGVSPEKQVNYGIPADEFVVVDSEITNIDTNWPMFTENDPFLMENGLNTPSGSAFRSAWSDSDPLNLPSISRNFMSLPEEGEHMIHDKMTTAGLTEPSNRVACNATSAPGESPFPYPRGPGIPTPSTGERVQTSASVAPAQSTKYSNFTGISRPDDIWTEIIS